MFFLSERTRLAATAAAILPSALATASSVRLGARWLSYSCYGYSSPLGQGDCFILFKAIPSLLIPQGTTGQGDQGVSGLGETNALRHENFQATTQKISQSYSRNGNDESGPTFEHDFK